MSNLISIVMPAFNAERHIAEAIESVIAQTHQAWELLVVDDWSTDETARIAERYAHDDRRIRLVKLARNSGPAIARNTGIELAAGRYVAFLDSDDIWFERKLEKQLAVMKERNAALCYSAYVIARDGDRRERAYAVPPNATYQRLLKGNVIGCLTVVLDTQVLGKRFFPVRNEILRDSWYGLFIDKIGHEDYALWLSILKDIEGTANAAVGVTEPLARYRVHSASFSSSKLKAALFQWIIYRRFEGLSLSQSLGNSVAYALRGIARHFG